MIVDSVGSPSVVFTAPFAGFYAVALEDLGSQFLYLNASALTGFAAQGGNGYVARGGVYFEQDDELSYQGAEATLHVGFEGAPVA